MRCFNVTAIGLRAATLKLRYATVDCLSREVIAIGLAVTFAAAGACAVLPIIYVVVGIGFAWTLLALAWIDWRTGRLPDLLTLSLCAAGLFVGALGGGTLDHILGAVAGFTGSALIAFGYRYWRGREGLGGGDVKFFGAIGAWLGWQLLPMAILLSCLSALTLALVWRRTAPTATLPFGPFIAAAGWAVWAWQIASRVPL